MQKYHNLILSVQLYPCIQQIVVTL